MFFFYLRSKAEDDVGVAAVGERVADGQVHPSHHPHLEQPLQALHDISLAFDSLVRRPRNVAILAPPEGRRERPPMPMEAEDKRGAKPGR